MSFPLLVLTKGSEVLREIPFLGERLAIGRARQNDVCIDDPAVSANHAEIVRSGDDLILQDLNSTNGTRVSGQPVHRHYLRDGDVIAVASFELHYKSDAVRQAAVDGRPRLCALDGPHKGKVISIASVPVTLGDVRAHAAVYVDRAGTAKVLRHPPGNGGTKSLDERELQHQEVFTVAGTTFQFFQW